MKQIAWTIALSVLTLAQWGCGSKNPSPRIAAQQLERSYEKADAPIKQEVAQATAALQAGNYTQAIVAMNRVAQNQPVNDAQKQAVDTLIRQTQLAVRQNPKLNSAELYRATSELILRVHGEN